MKAFIRTLVSKSKRRYTENGFNLDLTYITPRLIAMACPAEGTESIFRNPMSEVLRFLNAFHHYHFKIINLCAERDYNPEQLGGNVERIPVEDHQPAPLNEILRFCVLTEEWLAAHESNVVVTHCKAGKGRTGMMLSCYLLFSRYCPDPTAALHYYAHRRTQNGKGVTLPSQRRYVQYFQDMLYRNMWKLSIPKLLLTHIRFSSSPCWKADVHIVVSCNGGNGSYKLDSVVTALESKSQITVSKQQKCISYDVHPTWVAGDVKVEFYERKIQRQASNRSIHYKVEEQSIFYTCFNTLFIEGSQFALTSKDELDKPSSSLDSSFQVVFYFSHRLAEEKDGVICTKVSDSLTAECRHRLFNTRDSNRGDKFELR